MKRFGAYKIRPWSPVHLWGAGICVLGLSIFSYLNQNPPDPFPEAVFSTEPAAVSYPVLAQRNPSVWTEEDWQKFGLSQRQAAQMLKYRDKVLGGNFQSMDDLAAAYPLEDRPDLLNHLASFVQFPKVQGGKLYVKKSLNLNHPIDPNTMQETDWMALGLSERQATSIVRYRYSRGGTFSSVEEVGQSFVLREYMPVLRPWIRLSNAPEKESFAKKSFPKISQPFDPNTLDLKGWMRLGLSERQALGVLNYKNKALRGNFSSVEQLKQAYMLQGPIWNHISPWIRLKEMDNPAASQPAYVPRGIEEPSAPAVSVDINFLNAEHLKALGWNGAEIQAFLNYRMNLGNFASRTQLMEVPNVAKDKLIYLKSNHEFQPGNQTRIYLMSASAAVLEAHPYTRKYARLILFHRTSSKSPLEVLTKSGMSELEMTRLKPYLAQ